MTELKYDVVVHLVGEQLVPNYMAIKLSEAPVHILLATERTRLFHDKLQRAFGDRGLSIRLIEVPATDYRGVLERLESITGLGGLRVGVNLTGGTKVMMAVISAPIFTGWSRPRMMRRISGISRKYQKSTSTRGTARIRLM